MGNLRKNWGKWLWKGVDFLHIILVGVYVIFKIIDFLKR